MNNKTLKRVVAFLATALLVCSCAFAATIDDATVTYDAATGKIVVPFAPGEGATKAALLVKDASGEIVALAQFNSLKAEGNKFEETIDTTKLANGDTLAISVGDNAATSTSADTAEVVVPAYYTVKWVVEGVETTETYAAGATPEYKGETPVKAEDDDYTYEFKGWTPEIVAVNGDATYTAEFTATEKVKYYTINFVNYDGTVLYTTTVAEDTVPEYVGDAPVKEADEANTYAFIGWDKDIVAATEDTTYTATYEATPIVPDEETFTVTFVSEGATVATVEEVAAGTALSTLVPAEPTKAASGKKRYAFIGWYLDDAFATKMADNTVAADATLYAKFSMIGVHGDANADGNVNTFDLVELKNFFKDKETYAASGKKANTAIADCITGKDKTAKFGDANADGNVNTFDLVELKNYFKDKEGYLDQGKYASTDMKVVKD